MASGRVSIDFVTDEQFVKLIQIKDKSNSKLFFVAGQNVSPSNQSIGGKSTPGFSSINMQFNESDGAKFAAEVLEMIAT